MRTAMLVWDQRRNGFRRGGDPGRDRARRRRPAAARRRFPRRHPQPRRARRPPAHHPGGQASGEAQRYLPGVSLDVEDESELPAAVAEQARIGDGWVKLVGDWIDRGVGDLAPLWSDGVLAEAIAAAHAEGARVTAHVFGEDALPGLINAGIDCIEHGTGITEDVIALMLEHGTALVPTLINIENFPGIADAAAKYPKYATHMRELYATCHERVAAAHAGVPIFAGTDAGGTIAHGRIADEVEALKTVGLSRPMRWAQRPGTRVGGWAGPPWSTAHRRTWSFTPRTPVDLAR